MHLNSFFKLWAAHSPEASVPTPHDRIPPWRVFVLFLLPSISEELIFPSVRVLELWQMIAFQKPLDQIPNEEG